VNQPHANDIDWHSWYDCSGHQKWERNGCEITGSISPRGTTEFTLKARIGYFTTLEEAKGHMDLGMVSDGFHTFNELYEHRSALFCALAAEYQGDAWKSRKHADGTMYPGFFVAGIPIGMRPIRRNDPDTSAVDSIITYHLEDKWWEFLPNATELELAEPWDGHTPQMVVARLKISARRYAGETNDA
jgi:hypothetical protein